MKRNTLLIIVVLLLVAVGIYLVMTPEKSTIADSKDEYQFAVKDTASITKIVIRDKTPSEVTLTRDGSKWMLNDGLRPRKDAMEVLLETIYRMEMRSYVPNTTKETIRQRMDVFGSDVEIWAGDKLVKSFTVGNETPDQLGTYMKMKDSPNPFAVYIPGFNGYLNSRFFTSEDLWRSRVIWGFDNKEIKEIKAVYPYTPEANFTLQTEPQLKLLDGQGEEVEDYDEQKVQTYLAAFRTAQYEGAIVPTDKVYPKMDSIKASTEIVNILVTSKSGKSIRLRGYQIKAAPDTYDSNNELRKWDPDRIYGVINEETYVLMQYYGLQFILKGVYDFSSNPGVMIR